MTFLFPPKASKSQFMSTMWITNNPLGLYSHRFEVSIGDKPCGSCLLSKCEVVVDCLRGKVDNDRIRPPNHVYIYCIMDIIWKLSSQLEKRSFIYIRNCPHNDSWHSGRGSPYESKLKTLHGFNVWGEMFFSQFQTSETTAPLHWS